MTRRPMASNQRLRRVRRICSELPATTERASHGEPTFFVHGKVFVQAGLIKTSPGTFFKPPYGGGRGWVGIGLTQIKDDDLQFHIRMAWELVAPKRPPPERAIAARSSRPSSKRRRE